MRCNPFIFRSYDIRGVVNKDLTPDTARAIGQGFGTFIQQKKYGRRVVVGRDVRLSSPQLQEACMQGLRSTGCDVIDIGVSLTPMLYFALVFYGFEAGINITGSHNPKDQNGFKLAIHPIKSIYGEDLQTIRVIIEKNKFLIGVGSYEQKNIADDYIRETAKRVEMPKPVKLVMDCGNGTAGLYAPRLYRQLGCAVRELYCEVDGNFPHHLPDPQEHENMQDLRQKVLDEKADLGIAFDGDGDRVGMVDAQGKIYAGDILMIPLARAVLQDSPGASIIVDVKSTQVLLEAIRAAGGEPILGRTGPPNHKENMQKYQAPLAGEVSGHYFISEHHWGFDDGLYAGARIMQELQSAGQKLHEYMADVREMVATPEIKVECPDEIKFKIVDEARAYFAAKYKCVTVDGVRVNFSDSSWGLIRASNTTPNLTLRFEGATAEECAAVQQVVSGKLAEIFQHHGLQLPVDL